MSMTDANGKFDADVSAAVHYCNKLILQLALKYAKLYPANQNVTKRIGLFSVVERAQSNNTVAFVVAYCSSGKITYLNAGSFYAERHQWYDILNAAIAADPPNYPHAILLTKINAAPKA